MELPAILAIFHVMDVRLREILGAQPVLMDIGTMQLLPVMLVI